ncbi:glycogen debranching protein [Paenibacillus terrigena]|uniref:alpha-L-rhamnosidase-related protein n=1 Tax=Paenibacillus terrigena TaxID=369333 RepID=UPI0028D8EDF2|nr:glycogen debranching protein [Paenibacillus terrigena]
MYNSNSQLSSMQAVKSKHPFNVYLTAGEYVKAIGTQDGYFPDFGHHVANEMGGIWLHPIKLLDGFWLRVTDLDRNISVWSKSDEYITYPWGNAFHYDHGLGHIPISIERMQFAPEQVKGLVVHYDLHNYADRPTRLKLELLARTDLRPVWFSDEIGILDGAKDVVEANSNRLMHAKDCDHEWHAMIGTSLPGEDYEIGESLFGPEFTSGQGCGMKFETTVTLEPNEHLAFHLFVAGSYTSKQDCEETYQTLVNEHERLLVEKKSTYEAIRERVDLKIEGESLFNDIFAWVKWNNQWLVQKVDGIGRGLTAGSPHYPWWFGCDNSYSLQGVLAIGDHELAKDTMRILLEHSVKHNGNGRIVHEITTMGAVSNPGNTQETAHYISMVWDMYRWTGDRAFLQDHYAYCVQGMDWLLHEMDLDGDLLPSGYGIIEIAGLNMELIDSAVYTAKAMQALVQMSLELGEADRAEQYEALAKSAIQAINTTFWDEEQQLYADAVASKQDVLPKVEFLVGVAEQNGIQGYREYLEHQLARVQDETVDQGWLINKNWVISTPMEVGIADRAKGESAIRHMRNTDFIGPYGSYLSGTFQQGTMTISTGVHAVAEAMYGDADAALDLLLRMNQSFSRVLPGSMNEMSPDYGCAVQAWTVYALMVPTIVHLIGVQPEAHRHSVTIAPKIPTAWHGKEIQLNRVRIGDAWLDIKLCVDQGQLTLNVQNESQWNIQVDWNGKTYSFNDAIVEAALQ